MTDQYRIGNLPVNSLFADKEEVPYKILKKHNSHVTAYNMFDMKEQEFEDGDIVFKPSWLRGWEK